MAGSDITVTSLTAKPSFRGNKLEFDWLDPRGGGAANTPGALPNIVLDQVEILGSTTNDRATATLVTRGTTDALHAGIAEEETWYYWAQARNCRGSLGSPFPVSATGGVPCTSLGQASLVFGMTNGELAASVAGNALTIAIKTSLGNDPSALDPVFVAFRPAALDGGGYVIRKISAPLSITVPSGALLGITTTLAFRIWVLLFDDGGTLRLGVSQRFDEASNTVTALPEFGVLSATAISTGADFDAETYANVGITSQPYRLLGHVQFSSGLAVSGVYNVAPDVVRLFSFGSAKPGDVVKETSFLKSLTGGSWLGTAVVGTVIPWDGTVPQITEGTAFWTMVATLADTPNVLFIDGTFYCTYSTAAKLCISMFKQGVNDAEFTAWADCDVANKPATITMKRGFRLGNAGSTLVFKCSGHVIGTFYFDRDSSGAGYPGGINSALTFREIMA